MFSSSSYAEWTKLGTTGGGATTFYVDFERIRKHGGYVYYWYLLDNLKPDKTGVLSTKIYKQGDCKLIRYKVLSWFFHEEPMGRGDGDTSNPKNPEWKYPPPNSTGETSLKAVCSR
jgi:hypothetical protein